jgi:hypothetical protein
VLGYQQVKRLLRQNASCQTFVRVFFVDAVSARITPMVYYSNYPPSVWLLRDAGPEQSGTFMDEMTALPSIASVIVTNYFLCLLPNSLLPG